MSIEASDPKPGLSPSRLESVLAAEGEAETRIERARQEAGRLVEDARATARAIEARTRSRIDGLHGRFHEKLEREKAEVTETTRQETARQRPQWSDAEIEAASRRVAKHLIGLE